MAVKVQSKHYHHTKGVNLPRFASKNDLSEIAGSQ